MMDSNLKTKMENNKMNMITKRMVMKVITISTSSMMKMQMKNKNYKTKEEMRWAKVPKNLIRVFFFNSFPN